MNKSLIFALSTLAPLVMADEITLKDGTVHKDCKIEFETPESVTAQVKVSGNIRESMTFKREQIASITKQSPDELAAAKLKKRYVNVESMPAAELENVVADMDSTIKKNPKGLAHDAAVEIKTKATARIEALKAKAAAEAEAAAKEEESITERTRFDHEAGKLLKQFKAAKASKPFKAMAIYDRLRDDYPGSDALKQAYPDALKLAQDLDKKLEEKIKAREKAKQKERAAIAKEEADRRANAKHTREQQDAQRAFTNKKKDAITARESRLRKECDERRKEARQRGDSWYEPVGGSVESMRDVKRVSEAAVERLKNQQPEAGEGSAALAKAWQLCDEKKFDEAKDVLRDVRTARIDSEYYEELQETIRVGAQEQAAKEREARAAAARKAREGRDKKDKKVADKPKEEPKAESAAKEPAKKEAKPKATKKPKAAKPAADKKPKADDKK